MLKRYKVVSQVVNIIENLVFMHDIISEQGDHNSSATIPEISVILRKSPESLLKNYGHPLVLTMKYTVVALKITKSMNVS